MNTNKIQKYLLKLKDSFLEESEENKKMLDVYIKFIEGEATEDEIEYANNQLNEIFKSLGLGLTYILNRIDLVHLSCRLLKLHQSE